MKNLLWLTLSLCWMGVTAVLADDSGKSKNKEPSSPARRKEPERGTSGPEPIRYTITSSVKNVPVGEVFALRIVAHFMRISPSSLYTEVPSENRLRVVFPEGFVPTAGDCYENMLCQVSSKMPVQEWTIRGKFVSGEGVRSFILIRTDGSLSANTWIRKDNLTVRVLKGNEAVREAAAPAYSQCIESESTSAHSGGVYSNAGASGGSALWSYTGQSDYVDYTFTNVPSAGNYSFKLRYSTAERPSGSLVVNGSTVQQLSLPTTSTTSWYTYAETSLTVRLNAGTNTVRVRGGSGGSFHQDRVCLEGASAACIAPPAPAVAASASISAGQPATLSATGCDGSVRWKDDSGNVVGTLTAQSVTPAVTTTYTATCTVNDCESEASGPVTVVVTMPVSSGLANGCYRIKSKYTGNPISLVSGNLLEQRPADGSARQLWYAAQAGAGSYSFMTTDGSNLAIAASGDGFGTQLNAAAYTGASLQHWLVQNSGDGSYRISTASGSTWDIRNYGADAALQLWGSHSEQYYSYRLFVFESATCLTPGCSPPPVPTISPSGVTIAVGQTATLNASGCSGGVVTWSNGTTGATMQVQPAVTTPYTASCTVGACTSAPSGAATVTIASQAPNGLKVSSFTTSN